MEVAVNILFYTSDQYFSNQFKLLLGEDARTFSVYAFSRADRAKNYLAANASGLQCILTDASFLDEAMDSGVPVILLGEYSKLDCDDYETPVLNIYQKKMDVLEDLKQILRARNLINSAPVRTGSSKVISFFSTQGGSGTSALAYLTAMKAAERGKTVYLNLETTPGVSMFYRDSGKNAEEFFCAVKEREAPERSLIPGLTRNEHGVYTLPVPVSLMDQRELTREDIKFMMDGLLDAGDVAWLIVDLSGGFSERNDYVMSISDRVALVYGDDRAGATKRDKLLNDPAFSSYPCSGREMIVGNRCQKHYQDGRYDVCFPLSNSLAGGVDIHMVLQNNQDIGLSCEKILTL